ncbi:MAG: alpha/beta hydrolase-fold protein [Planctomycetaceae bacterium]
MQRLLIGTISALSFMTCVASTSAQDVTRPGRREPKPEIHYPLTADSLKQDDVPQGKLEGPFLFQSSIIENTTRQYWIFVPAQYDAAQEACVLVFQDGARATNPNGALRVPTVLENLIAKKQIPVTIGIFITPGQRGTEFPDTIGTGNPDNRDREYDVLDDRYARFIIDEMLPEVGAQYNLTQHPAGRAIGGASSGAICAFTVAWHRPDEFRNVVSMIGSFTDIHGGHAYPDLIRLSARKPIRIFLQDGVNDLRNPDNLERDWHIQNQKMVTALVEREYDCAYVFGDGGHSDDHGGAMLPLMLRRSGVTIRVWSSRPSI